MTCNCECHEPGAIVFHAFPCCDECYQVRVLPLTPENRPVLMDAMLAPFVGMPCRVCGETLTRSDVYDDDAVRAGDSADGRTSVAHSGCWRRYVADPAGVGLVHP